MEDREGGYTFFFRSVESSPDFLGLRADQSWVAIRLTQLANFKPAFCRIRGQAVRVERGELAHSLETIAERTNVTVKVARTTINRLLKSGFLSSREIEISGTAAGTGPGTKVRILRVVSYDKFNPHGEFAGTTPGTPAGSDRAGDGHAPGTDRALREEGEERSNDQIPPTPQAENRHSRPARLGVGSPAFEAADHWTRVVWPKLSRSPCEPVTAAQAQRLAELSSRRGAAEVCSAMSRAAADPFWSDKLDLDVFLSRPDRFAARKTAISVVATEKARRAPQPSATDFTDPRPPWDPSFDLEEQ
jgi:hypothetical protein